MTSRRDRWLVLTHPACLARHPQAAAELRRAFAARGLRVPWYERDWPEVSAIAGRYDGIWVAGGDGSVRRAAGLAIEAGVPLAIAPLGTANDFARHFGLAAFGLDALVERTLAARAPASVDVGLVNGELFLNACHVGLGVSAALCASGRLKRWLGPLAYPAAALLAFGKRRAQRMTLRLGGMESRTIAATHVIVGNGRYFGGGMTFAPDARLDDGLLDVQAISGRWGLGRWMRWAFRRRMALELEPDDTWLHVRVPRLILGLRRREVWVNLDGDAYRLAAPLSFRSEGRRLWLWLPQGAMAREEGLPGPAREGARP